MRVLLGERLFCFLSNGWKLQSRTAAQSCKLFPEASGVVTGSYLRQLGPQNTRRNRQAGLQRAREAGRVSRALSTDKSHASREGKSGAAESKLCVLAPSEMDTQLIAEALASNNMAGDCYCLYGEVGAGKSAFSRAFIRATAEDEDLPVPSPTYLLQNIYDQHKGPPIHHFDLYRLAGPDDMGRLSFSDSLANAVCLVEWSERLQDLTPSCRMKVLITALEESSEENYRSLVHPWDQSAADADEEEYCKYTDRKWRKLSFVAEGDRMAAKLASLAAVLQREDVMQRSGLRVLPPNCHGL